MNELLAQKLRCLPEKPGVYIMRDIKGKIIYVGKAIVLKNRVRQYFQSNKNHSPKVISMVNHIADFETIITGSELEALILECNLIKKHHPKYNISLKDDKSYPYIKVTVNEVYPRLFMTHRVLNDGARYFGPYANAGAAKESMRLMQRTFCLRTCKNMNVSRPCLEYHIKRCLAPCAGKVGEKEYKKMIDTVIMFLEGKSEAVEKRLKRQMEKAAEVLDFERAALLRDQLVAVKKTVEKQKMFLAEKEDKDIIGLSRSDIGLCVQVFYVRQGKMLGRSHYLLENASDEADEAVLTAFFKQYYECAASCPDSILLPFALKEGALLEKWLARTYDKKVKLLVPQRGMKRDLVKFAEENAQKYLSDLQNRAEEKEQDLKRAMVQLGEYLGLEKAPRRMECFDISHIQGSETVASMVVFEDGKAKKSDYRRFKLIATEGKPDDFLSMQEVTQRRYVKEKWSLPDLIIIDGGKGQLSAALKIIRGAGHFSVPVVGLAKQFEYIFKEGESDPVILPRGSGALYLVQRIRDEAHRFAITYHRKLRNRRNLVSILDHIEGIGPKRRKALWDFFGSLEAIKAASCEQLAVVPAMTKAAANAVYNFFAAQKAAH